MTWEQDKPAILKQLHSDSATREQCLDSGRKYGLKEAWQSARNIEVISLTEECNSLHSSLSNLVTEFESHFVNGDSWSEGLRKAWEDARTTLEKAKK